MPSSVCVGSLPFVPLPLPASFSTASSEVGGVAERGGAEEEEVGDANEGEV